jgi:hypothetical protein
MPAKTKCAAIYWCWYFWQMSLSLMFSSCLQAFKFISTSKKAHKIGYQFYLLRWKPINLCADNSSSTPTVLPCFYSELDLNHLFYFFRLLTLARTVGISVNFNSATKEYKARLKLPLPKPIEKRGRARKMR